ncbi:hypothetical protein MOD31_20195 [Paenarthrobacter sp. TYUT067]|uniref:hypothetical protein n=1 Tax=Micrococcaceae TaxID=1268 RepID=UPI001EE7D655|nr:MULTISPECIES: hypothetical protein [Micrococcaceae]MCM0618351.1 hypothetical protein [Paenarthrobacter sp. TYUT067]
MPVQVHAALAEFSEVDGVAAVGTQKQRVGREAQRGGGERFGGEGVDAVVGAVFAGFSIQ